MIIGIYFLSPWVVISSFGQWISLYDLYFLEVAEISCVVKYFFNLSEWFIHVWKEWVLDVS